MRYSLSFLLLVLSINGYAQNFIGKIYINEFMAGNVNSWENPDLPGNFSDWIELYNYSSENLDVSGLYLTDNSDHLRKWKIPEGLSIPSKGFLLIYADRHTELGNNHANFQLGTSEGEIFLVDRDGFTVIDGVVYGQQFGNTSYGKYPDGEFVRHFMVQSTPGRANYKGVEHASEQPTFSHKHGFYTEPIQLTLKCSQENSEIYYTLDGSSPDNKYDAATIRYTAPINITTTAIVRAKTLTPGTIPSESVSQTYLYVKDVKNQPAEPAGFDLSWGHVGADYEMDPEVVYSPEYEDIMEDALQDLPILSLIMDHDDWFTKQGIYDGRIYKELVKRKVSIEMFNFEDSSEFQINGSVMIVGGSSVSRWKSDKLSMRIGFDIAYGQGKLNFPVLGNSVNTFNSLTVDAALNNAWHYGGGSGIKGRVDLDQEDIAQYTRDSYIAELHNEMGGYSPHGKKVQVYINGLFWGMHWLHERPDEHFAANYLGGNPEDYSILKHTWEDVEYGNNENFVSLLTLLNADLTKPAYFDKVKEKLDVEGLIDYILLNMLLGNSDWDNKNLYFSYNESSGDGKWRYHSWDAEHIMEGIYNSLPGSYTYGQPTHLHKKLMQSAEYRFILMDRINKLFYNDGIFTTEKLKEIYVKMTDEVYLATVAESARWGDNQREIPFTRNIEWQTEFDWLMNEYFVIRPEYVLGMLKDEGWVSEVMEPKFKYKDELFTLGFVAKGENLDYESTTNTIYYTTNGEDPIDFSKVYPVDKNIFEINSNAIKLTAPININNNVLIKARATNGVKWSALAEVKAIVNSNYNDLKVTEINYDPTSGTQPSYDYEFIEFKNIGSEPIDLSLAKFSGGIEYTCPFGTVVEAGEYLVLASDDESFTERYNVIADGEFEKRLSNGGESISIIDFAGDLVTSFNFLPYAPWPELIHRPGHSIVSTETNPTGNPSSPEYWTFSCWNTGSPYSSEESCLSSVSNTIKEGSIGLKVYPNPFTNYSNIEIRLEKQSNTSLIIYDIYGRKVDQLVNKVLMPGSYRFNWVTESIPSGMYIIYLQTDDANESAKILKNLF